MSYIFKKILIFFGLFDERLITEETIEEKNLRKGHQLLFQYNENNKKGLKHKKYTKEEVSLISDAIGDKFKLIKMNK